MKYAKGYEQNFSTEMFQAVKFIHRMPVPVYELSDLQPRPIEGKFYTCELVMVTVSPSRVSNRLNSAYPLQKWYLTTSCPVER